MAASTNSANSYPTFLLTPLSAFVVSAIVLATAALSVALLPPPLVIDAPTSGRLSASLTNLRA